MAYDSREDTINHIEQVRIRLYNVIHQIERRAYYHDASKLKEPEKSFFDAATERLRGLTYGSEEYKQSLKEMKPALDHHYQHNSHHPEHYSDGIRGMDLIDLIEMYCDWSAAVTRHADGNLLKSINHNESRFMMDPQLAQIFKNTFHRFKGFEINTK